MTRTSQSSRLDSLRVNLPVPGIDQLFRRRGQQAIRDGLVGCRPGSTIAIADHLQMKVSRRRHLSAAFLWLGDNTRPIHRCGLIPRIRTILKSSFALLW
jgi:hypothetical protein